MNVTALGSNRRRLLAAVSGVVIVAAGVVALVARGATDPRGATSSSAPTSPVGSSPATPARSPSSEWAWLDQFGDETALPPVPADWQIIDFADLRFAVPADWTVPIATSCAQPALGLVLVPAALDSQTSCSPTPTSPSSTITIRRSTGDEQPGEQVAIGTLHATRVIAADCAQCSATYRFDDGYDVTIAGSDSERILATFTESGTRRALQHGTMVDTTGWQQVRHDGIGFLVPASWKVIDLPATLFTTTDAAGNINGGGGMADPGTCGGSLFPDGPPSALLGASHLVPSCPAILTLDLSPRDGVWIRAASDTDTKPVGPIIAHGTVSGLDVTIVSVEQSSNPTVELIIDTNPGEVRISLGVGPDAAIARSILQSIHSAN